eukprot:gene4425-8810_t
MSIQFFSSWPSGDEFTTLSREFVPFVVRTEAAIDIQPNDLVQYHDLVDVSYLGNNSEFSGDSMNREMIYISISKFAQGFLDAASGKPHWLQDAELKLFISQCTIFSDDTDTTPILSCLYKHIHIPDIIKSQQLQQINLWMNIQSVSSAPHYDGYHNILTVIKGSKTIHLKSPKCTEFIIAKPAFTSSPNHSLLSSEIFQNLKLSTSDNSNSNMLDIKVKLEEGQSIFIPEGYWHQITSETCTMALSYWFKSPLYPFIQNEQLQPYIFRTMLNELITSKMKEIPKLISTSSSNNTNSILDNNKLLSNININISNMTQIEFNELLHSYHIENDVLRKQDIMIAIATSDLQDMMRLMPAYAKDFSSEWIAFLLSLGPEAAYMLSTTWDTSSDKILPMKTSENVNEKVLVDNENGNGNGNKSEKNGSEKFFSSIFDPCGDAGIEIQRHILRQTDKLRKNVAANVMVNILGLEDNSILLGSVRKRKRSHDLEE